MFAKLNLTTLRRRDLLKIDEAECYGYEINRDYLTNEKTTFNPIKKMECEQGDLILAKTESGKYLEGILSDDEIKPIYIGVIDSFDGNSIEVCDIYNLLNFEFVATRKTGVNGEGHLLNLIERYLIQPTKNFPRTLDITIDNTNPTAYSYQPSDPPTPTNLKDYFIQFFKKYNIVWEVDSVHYVPSLPFISPSLVEKGVTYNTSAMLGVETSIVRRTETINLKNNVYNFVNWSVYVTPANIGVENMLQIVDKRTTDSENPIILSTWYLTKDGGLTQSVNDDIDYPTRTKVVIYDTTEDEPPTFLEVAQSELAGSTYAHEINFDINADNNFFDVTDLKIGMLANIVYDDTIFSSVLTGYVIKSDSKWISLRFGNIRSTLQSVIDNL